MDNEKQSRLETLARMVQEDLFQAIKRDRERAIEEAIEQGMRADLGRSNDQR